MTKEQILKLTGLTEAEFYKKYPTKDAFYKDYPNAKRKMERGGDMSGGAVNPADLNKDRMRTTTRLETEAEAGLRGLAEGLGAFMPGQSAMIEAGKNKMQESGLRLSKGPASTIGQGIGTAIGTGATMVMQAAGAGAFGKKGAGTTPTKTGIPSTAKPTGQFAPELIQSGFNAQDALKKIQQIQSAGQQTSYVPGMYDTGVYTAMNGGMYRDGGVMNNTGNLGLTDLKGPRHADGGIALNEDVEVEGEETIYTPERYVFSEVMKASKDALKEAGLSPSYAGRSYSSLSRSFKNSVDTLRGSEDKLAQRAVDQKLKKLIDAHEYDRSVKRERDAKNVVAQTPEERAGGYNMFPNAESIMFPGQGQATVVPADNQMPIEVTGADGSQQILTNSPVQTQAPFMERKMKKGGKMIKRADGSYSRRGLWDNIRANRGSGRKPTKEMLEQERKIKAAEKAMGGYYYADGGLMDDPIREMQKKYIKMVADVSTSAKNFDKRLGITPLSKYDDGGYMAGDGSDQPDGSYWRSSDDMTYYMYGGGLKNYPTMQAEGGKLMYQQDYGVLPDKSNAIQDMGKFVYNEGLKDSVWVPNWEGMSKQAADLGLKNVKTQSGRTVKNIQNFTNPELFMNPTPRKSFLNKTIKAQGGKLPEGILRSRLESHMSPSEVENYMESYAYGGNLGRTNYDVYVNSPSYFRAEGGSFDNPGFRALPEYVQNKIKSNMQDGGELYMGEAPEYADMEGYDLDQDEATEYKEGGSYRVYRTSERKGKTHKVVGPGGKVKYFGDPKMGERGKSKYGKKAFYARHRKNLAKNPFFRAYARATWEDGGEFGSPDNNYYFGDASGSYLNAMQEGGMMVANPVAQPEVSQEEAKVMQAVAGMLMQGAQPEQVLQQLVKAGIPEETSAVIIQNVMQQMQAESVQQPGSPEQMLGMGQPSEEEMAMAQAQAQQQGMMAYGGPMQYKKGGIYIKPSKRGSFTAWAKRHDMGVQEAARHVMANKEDYSSAIVKKANFAKNAAGWKHAMGGRLKYQQDLGLLPSYGYGAIDQFEDTSGTFISDPNSPDYGKPMGMQKGSGYAQYGKDNVGKLTVKEIEDYAINTIGKDTWNKIPDDLKTLWYDASFNSRLNKEYFLRGLAQAIQDSDPNFQYPATMGSTPEDYKNYRNNMTDAEALDIIRKANFNDPNMDIAGNYINILNQQRESLGKRSNFPEEYMKTYNRRAIDVYNNFQNLKNQANQNSITTNNTTTTPVVNQPVVSNASPTTTTSGAAQRMMETYFPNPLLKNINQQSTSKQPLTGFPLLSYGVEQGDEYTGKPYKSSIAPYIAGGIGSAVGPLANIIAAAAIPDATYTPAAKFQRLGYTPVALARQQANQAIASTREALRMAAPTQGSYLSNLAVSLPTTASSLGSTLAQTRYGIDAANIDIANKEALNRQAVAQQNALLKDQSIAQRWNLGLAAAEGLGKGVQGLTRDLSQKEREDQFINQLATKDFAGIDYEIDPKTKTYRMIPSLRGRATYQDKEGNQIIKDKNGKKYVVVNGVLKEIVE